MSKQTNLSADEIKRLNARLRIISNYVREAWQPSPDPVTKKTVGKEKSWFFFSDLAAHGGYGALYCYLGKDKIAKHACITKGDAYKACEEALIRDGLLRLTGDMEGSTGKIEVLSTVLSREAWEYELLQRQHGKARNTQPAILPGDYDPSPETVSTVPPTPGVPTQAVNVPQAVSGSPVATVGVSVNGQTSERCDFCKGPMKPADRGLLCATAANNQKDCPNGAAVYLGMPAI